MKHVFPRRDCNCKISIKIIYCSACGAERWRRGMIEDVEGQLLALPGVGDGKYGQVMLACIPTAAFYLLPRAIERFNAQFPRIRFRILDLAANEGLESVARGEAEFGINLTGSSHPDLSFEPLLDDPFFLACPPAHPLARRRKLAWTDLEAHLPISV